MHDGGTMRFCNYHVARVRVCTYSILAGAILLSIGAMPAAASLAPVNCAAPNYQIGVAFMGMSAAQNIVLQQRPDLRYEGQVTVRVFCMQGTTDLGEVANAQVAITTSVPDITFDGYVATPTTPVNISLPIGIKVVDIVADQNTLAADQFFARVGGDSITAVKAYGSSIPDGYGLTMTGNLFAATPELDSLMLFGTGGLGLAGYALMRRRARRK
jgi:hypothetical protein